MNIEADAGESVFSLVKRAVEYTRHNDTPIGITHNETTVSVYPESCIHDILEKIHYLREYQRASKQLDRLTQSF